MALHPGGGGMREREVAVLGRLRLGGQQPLGAVLPAGRDRGFELEAVVVGEPERHEARPQPVALGDMGGIRALREVEEVVDPAGPPGRLGIPLEVVARQAALAVGRRERLVRQRPVRLLDRGAPLLDRAHSSILQVKADNPNPGDRATSWCMRRTGLAVLALLLAFALPGCGGSEESPGPGGGNDEPTTTKTGSYGY